MRNVARGRKPRVLTKHALRWKREYLDALASGNAKLIARRRMRYGHPDVRAALETMYQKLCCYCENHVGPIRAGQIEHRKPAAQFPELSFEWDNLHLSCSGCNRAKSNKWDAAHPILDAVADVPVKDHLDYECSETGVRRMWLSPRGKTTVTDTELNREDLRESVTVVLPRGLNHIRRPRKW